MSETARLQLEYVRIATVILQRPSTSDSQRPMREWAVALLNHSAPVKLSPEQVEALTSGAVTLPYSNYDSYGDYGWNDYREKKRTMPVTPSPTPFPP